MKIVKRVLKNKKILSGAVGVALVASLVSPALALRILPKRVVLGTDVRSQHVFVNNSSDQPQTYRFGWRHIAMAEDGTVVNLDLDEGASVPGYRPLDDYVRFSPRRVKLAPGETQRVSFLVQRKPDMQDGEYRSHFHIMREPKVSKVSDGEAAEKKAATEGGNTTSVNVSFNVSRAVPVYLHHGEVSAALTLEEARVASKKVPDGQEKLSVRFRAKKEGNRSIIALANVVCKDGGAVQKLSAVPKLFAIYAEAAHVTNDVIFEMPDGGCQSIAVQVVGHKDDLLAGEKLAERAVAQ